MNQAAQDGKTPTCGTAFKGHVEVVRALHELGADVNRAKHNGCTPTYIAAENGHVEVVRALHELGQTNRRRASDALPLISLRRMATWRSSGLSTPSGPT